MIDKQAFILKSIKEKIELIESERYNSKDPILQIEGKDSTDDIIIKLLTAERTGAPLKIGKEILNPAEDLAIKYFESGVRSLNTWQFKSSNQFLSDAAEKAYNKTLQQRINLFKQLNNLLHKVIHVTPDNAVKNTQSLFDDIITSISKYDQFDDSEKNFYRQSINSVYHIVCQLSKDDVESKTHQLLARCSISLSNKEYLAAYIWLFKIYLLNKEIFDTLASDDEILKIAISNLKVYLENETGLGEEKINDLPVMASAYDLQTIFIDHLNNIFDSEFFEKTSEIFAFKNYRES
ncbi:MAG: hypothetical protein JXA54_00240 [Candidatus Heimdallarchaeota archaeon]|nr:hypothetical protein [Candidatus Heimdallarchaeota archaeon]